MLVQKGEEKMVTTKRFNIPIFSYRLSVIIFDNWEDLTELIPRDIYDDSYDSRGITINFGGSGIICVRADCPSTLIHECEHSKNYIWQHIGYEPSARNDEVDAYLLTYLYEKVVEVFNKHTSNQKHFTN